MAHHGHQYGYGPYPNYPNGQPYRAPPHEVMHKFGNRNNADPEPPPSPEPPREAWGRRHDLSDGTSETHITGMLSSQLLSSTADVNGQTWYQQSNQLSSNNLSPETPSRAYSNSRHRGRNSLGRICTRYPSSYFTPGRIFIVRWPENAGQRDASRSGNSEIFYDSQGNRFFSTWRRMIVVSTYPGSNSSTCVGIYTYGGRGLSKHGIHVESHAVLYDEREGRPTMSSGEPEVRREALAVNLHSRSEKLDPMSRANFGNLHTVQHNIEICNIGQISTRSMATFNAYVNERFDAIRRF